MSKKKKNAEPIYRTSDGMRWRILEPKTNYSISKNYVMACRVKDGHRMFVAEENLTLEK